MRGLIVLGLLAIGATANAGGMRDQVEAPAAAHGGHEGEVVLWGGKVVAYSNVGKQVCAEISSRRIQRDGQPTNYYDGGGQLFLACDVSGLIPAGVDIGRKATFAGKVDRVISRVEKTFCMEDSWRADYAGTRRERVKGGGCRVWLPVVVTTDAKTWNMPIVMAPYQSPGLR